MTNLLALVGSKGSGKTTLSKLLAPYDWKQTSFATPIKRMIATLLLDQGVSGNDVSSMLYGENKETPTPFLNYKTPRHAMQTIGSEWRDLIDKNLWLDIWQRTINLKFEKIIVDDLRFLHEANRVRSLGGKIIQIDRHGLDPKDNHISETDLFKIKPDFVITNCWEPKAMLDQLIIHLPGVTNK